MDQLAARGRGIARVVIAGLLALVLVAQSAASVARPRDESVALAIGLLHCSSDQERPPPATGEHLACDCCLPCRSSPHGAPALLAAVPPESAELPAPPAGVFLADPAAPRREAPPCGWTSSWSQRAPPASRSRSSSPEALGA